MRCNLRIVPRLGLPNRRLGSCVIALCTALVQPVHGQSPGTVIEYHDPTTVHRLSTRQMQVNVGGSDGVDFYRVTAILPRSDGAFVVVNAGTNELQLFDSAGALRWSVGRGGRGPGEFSDIRGAALLPGDSILVFDVVGRRISVLDPRGNFLRSFLLSTPFDGGGFPTLMVALRDGTLLVGYSEVRTTIPQPQAAYSGQRLFQYSTTGELRSPDGLRLPNRERFVQAVPPNMGGVAYWDLAFGRRMTIRADSNWILTGDGTTWSVEQRTARGAVMKTHRLARSTEPVTAQDKSAFRARSLERSQPGRRAVITKMLADMPYPQTKPAYRRFETDDLGRLWLEVYAPREETQANWIRVDPRTQHVVAVQFPPRFRAFAFRADLVYGVWRDSDDVEYVQVYALE